MNYETILVETDGPVATVTLNRPERLNAFTVRMGDELSDAFARLDADDSVRAVILTGSGRAFCAGADLDPSGKTFSNFVESGESDTEDVQSRPRMDPWMMRKPVIAALNGHAIGVGLTLAMQCDVRYAAADAKLSFAFVRRGIIPELSSHAIVPRVLGLSRALELMLSGRTLTGEEAERQGLVSKAMPRDEVLPAAMEYARDIAENAAPLSVAISKRLIWEGLTDSLDSMRRKENVLFAWAASQPDAVEGVKAFFEKRPPEWKLRPSVDYPEWPS